MTDIDIYHLDSGVIIQLDCKTDVTAASALKMQIKKPDTTIVEVTAVQGDTNDKIKYTVPTSGSPFASEGSYSLRSKITFGASQDQSGDPVRLYVGESWVPS